MTSVALVLQPDRLRGVDLDVLWTGSQAHPVSAQFAELLTGLAVPDAAIDFLLLACAAYVADKSVRRDLTPDAWTRDIELHMPQLDQSRFDAEAVRRVLVHMTGDRWTIKMFEVQREWLPFDIAQQQQPVDVSAVALFSGGLDSFAHLAATAEPTLFVSQTQRSELNALQQVLCQKNGSAGSVLRQFSFILNRRPPLPPPPFDLESSTRSRSLLFFAAAVAAAAALAIETVVVPENGFVSLNPPLVAARRGTLSTRTTHPTTIHLVNGLLQDGGLNVTLVNPFMRYSKGEVAAVALGAAPTSATLATVSCSRASSRTGGPIHYGNCGYCFPCLVRRAGILATGTIDRTRYRVDPRRDRRFLTSPTGDDFRAVIARARVPFTLADLRITASLAPSLDDLSALAVVERGRVELENMIEQGLTNQMRTVLDW